MAAWRGNRRLTWATGVGLVPGVGRRGVHGLSLAAELRLAMDIDPGQGRHQRHRSRRGVERLELRPDADVAHRPAANRRRVDRRPPCPARPAAWHRPSLRTHFRPAARGAPEHAPERGSA